MRVFLVLLSTLLFSASTAIAADRPPGHVQSVGTAPVRSVPSGKATVRILAAPDHGETQNAFLAVLELAPGAAVPEHADATEEYIYVLEGGGKLTIDGVVHTLTVGDAVFMPAHAVVTYQNGDVASKVLQVFAGPAPAAKYDKWIAK